MIVNEEEDLNNCIINIKSKQKKVENKLNLERSSNISKEFSNLKDEEEKLENREYELDNKEDELNSKKDEIDNKQNELQNKKDQLENIKTNTLANITQKLDVISNNNLDNNLNIKEIDLDEILEEKDKIDLKDAEMVYYEIYKAARKKAKEIKKNAIEAYLEVKKIKNQYMLNDIDDSSESDIEELENNI